MMEQPGTSNSKRIMAIAGLLAIVVIIAVATAISSKDKGASDTAATPASDSSDASTQATTSDSGTAANNSQSSSTSTYKNGTYQATGSYSNPGGTSKLGVKLTVKDGVVTDSEVTAEAIDGESKEYQQRFISGYKTQVVGKKIDDIKLSRVSGSSLTSQGFNDALDQIKTQAEA